MEENSESEYSLRGSSEEDVGLISASGLRLCRSPVRAYADNNDVIWYSNVYAIPVISFVGVVSNVINAAVLWKTGKRLPSHTYLLALAVCDCVFLTFATLEVTPVMLDSFASSPICNKIYTHSILYIRLISSSCFKMSVMLVVGFNVERYICVCRPMRSRSFCNKRNARKAIYLFVFVSITLSVHWPLVHETDRCWDETNNDTFYMIRLPEPDHPLMVYGRIMNYVSMILFNVAPIFALFVLNALILRTLRNVILRESSDNSSDDIRRRSKSANAILFAVVLMFLICNGPQVPARFLLEKFGPYSDLVNVYAALSQQLIFMNASLNFCLYCLVSKRYRKLLRRTFPCFPNVKMDLFARIKARKADFVVKITPGRNVSVLGPGTILKPDDISQGCRPILQYETDTT